MTTPNGITIRGTAGKADAERRLLVLYTGGTIGMTPNADGALVPLDLIELPQYVPGFGDLGVALTVASFSTPLDSSSMRPEDWLTIARFLTDHLADHDAAVVLHGTDTMAYTASALSFLIDGLDRPIVLTGAQRPLTSARTDGRENLMTAAGFALLRTVDGAPAVPEVAIAFDDVLLRGNRATKSSASADRAFTSPNDAPLGAAGVTLTVDAHRVRPAAAGPLRVSANRLDADVAVLSLHPAITAAAVEAIVGRPEVQGVIVEAYGAGNGPSDEAFLAPLIAAVARGVVVVVITQCGSGSVVPGAYATDLVGRIGTVAGADLTLEAAVTKLVVLLSTHDAETTRRLMSADVAGELTIAP